MASLAHLPPGPAALVVEALHPRDLLALRATSPALRRMVHESRDAVLLRARGAFAPLRILHEAPRADLLRLPLEIVRIRRAMRALWFCVVAATFPGHVRVLNLIFPYTLAECQLLHIHIGRDAFMGLVDDDHDDAHYNLCQLQRRVRGAEFVVDADCMSLPIEATTATSLVARGCPRLEDVSLAALATAVSFTSCSALTNVRPLARVRMVDLSGCVELADVSALGRVHTLRLDWCTSLLDVSALGGVHTLSLCGTRVEDVRALGNVYSLNLSYNHMLSEVACLGGVTILRMDDCPLVTDLSALSRVKHLSHSRFLLRDAAGDD